MAFVYWIHLPEHTDPKSQGYIGHTTGTVEKRYKRGHLSSARRGSNLKVHNAIRKYGDKLIVTTLLEDTVEFCQLVEWGYRDKSDTGWNHSIGGEASRKGSKTSDETKQKLSKIGKGRKHSAETRANMKAAQSKRIWTDADRDRIRQISLSRKGVRLSEDHKRKLSEVSRHDGKFTDSAREKAAEFHRIQSPWERGRSNKAVWCDSPLMYNEYLINSDIGEVSLANKFGMAPYQVRKVLKHFRSGWVPCSDVKFAAWLLEYNKTQKECNESTLAT